MRTKEQIEKEKQMMTSLKKVDQKLKKDEREEQCLNKLLDLAHDESKLNLNKASGVMLLSNRFSTKLPVNETL